MRTTSDGREIELPRAASGGPPAGAGIGLAAACVLSVAIMVTWMFAGAALAQELSPPLRTLDSRWRLSRSRPVDEGSALTALRLPLGLYVVARDDLADVRLLAVDIAAEQAEEIPFTIWRPSDIRQVGEVAAEQTAPVRGDGGTEIVLDPAPAKTMVSAIQIDVADGAGDYQRDVRVYGLNDRDSPGELLTDAGLLYCAAGSGRTTKICRVEFPPADYAAYRVVIADGDQAPLPVTAVRAIERIEALAPRTDVSTIRMTWNRDEAANRTIVEADLLYRNLPTHGVRLDVEYDGDFRRVAHVDVCDNPDEFNAWKRVATFDLYRFRRSGGGTIEQTAVEYPEGRGGIVRITIENGGERPLKVLDVTAVTIDRWLVCESRALTESGKNVALYAGDKHRAAPAYDRAPSATEIGLDRLTDEFTFGQREANPFKLKSYDPQTYEPAAGSSAGWWLAGVAVLIAIAAGVLFRKAGRTEAT